MCDSLAKNLTIATGNHQIPQQLAHQRHVSRLIQAARFRRRTRRSQSNKEGLTFPVARINRYLKTRNSTSIIAKDAAVFTTAVLEYLTAEVLDLAGNGVKRQKKKIITPRFLELEIVNDQELNGLIGTHTIPGSGVMPYIPPQLLPKKRKTKAAVEQTKMTCEECEKMK